MSTICLPELVNNLHSVEFLRLMNIFSVLAAFSFKCLIFYWRKWNYSQTETKRMLSSNEIRMEWKEGKKIIESFHEFKAFSRSDVVFGCWITFCFIFESFNSSKARCNLKASSSKYTGNLSGPRVKSEKKMKRKTRKNFICLSKINSISEFFHSPPSLDASSFFILSPPPLPFLQSVGLTFLVILRVGVSFPSHRNQIRGEEFVWIICQIHSTTE